MARSLISIVILQTLLFALVVSAVGTGVLVTSVSSNATYTTKKPASTTTPVFTSAGGVATNVPPTGGANIEAAGKISVLVVGLVGGMVLGF